MRTTKVLPDWADQPGGYAQAVAETLSHSDYTPVFNLSGTIIHTNLGRAVLSEQLWRGIEPLITRPMNLEYDLSAGKRGKRRRGEHWPYVAALRFPFLEIGPWRLLQLEEDPHVLPVPNGRQHMTVSRLSDGGGACCKSGGGGP